MNSARLDFISRRIRRIITGHTGTYRRGRPRQVAGKRAGRPEPVQTGRHRGVKTGTHIEEGNKFAFVSLSDGGGAFEITVFSELLAAKRDVMEAGQAILVDVDAQTRRPRRREFRRRRVRSALHRAEYEIFG